VNEYLTNINFMQQVKSTTAHAKKRIRKKSDLDRIDDEFDKKRATLYNAARSEAIVTVDKIERKLRSTLQAFDGMSNQYNARVKSSLESLI